MAIGWLTVLQSIPWSDVISNAPKVVDGAKKLWSTVSGKPGTSGPAEAVRAATGPTAMVTRLDRIETDVAALHQQMLESAELIKSLANQNAQLIVRIDENRQGMRWLLGLAALATVVAIVALLAIWAQLQA